VPSTRKAIGRTFAAGRSDVPVEGEGTVSRALEGDLNGRRHQRFVLRLASGQAVLVAHNIEDVWEHSRLG
jgi:hypothetical protein